MSETRTFSLANGHVHSKHIDKTHCFWGTEAWRSGALHQLQSEAGPVQSVQWLQLKRMVPYGSIWSHEIISGTVKNGGMFGSNLWLSMNDYPWMLSGCSFIFGITRNPHALGLPRRNSGLGFLQNTVVKYWHFDTFCLPLKRRTGFVG